MTSLRIAISGKSGCGNTTVSRLVADALGLRFINFTLRSLAEEHGMGLAEILSRSALDDAWDKAVDTRQVALARESAQGCVLGSRLAIWMLPEADLKVYLKASSTTRAERILKREGGILASVAAFTAQRDAQDTARFKRIYGINNNDYAFADLIIDTDVLDPQGIVTRILEKARALGH